MGESQMGYDLIPKVVPWCRGAPQQAAPWEV